MNIANSLTLPFFCVGFIFASLASYSDISKVMSLINEKSYAIDTWGTFQPEARKSKKYTLKKFLLLLIKFFFLDFRMTTDQA